MAIVILPIVNISGQMLGDLKKELGNTFLSGIEIADSIRSLPDGSYNKGREQYDAAALIQYLESEFGKSPAGSTKAEKVIAVGNFDIFTKPMDFVFGVAQKGGQFCMISLYRLDPRFYSKESSYDKLSERAVKEATHELGHCYGLDHCKDKDCVMSYSNDIMSVDQKTHFFCEDCREKLRKAF